jgi:hypothetical protein
MQAELQRLHTSIGDAIKERDGEVMAVQVKLATLRKFGTWIQL